MRIAPLLLLLLGATTRMSAQQAAEQVGLPTAADLHYAFSTKGAGWFRYQSNRSPQGDSASQIAAAAMWALEGGDPRRGERLLAKALRSGVSDTVFYRDVDQALRDSRCADEAETFRELIRKWWPRAGWLTHIDSASAVRRSSTRSKQSRCWLRLPPVSAIVRPPSNER